MSAGEAGRHVAGLLDLFIDAFKEVQNKRLYSVDYIAYGFHLWYKDLIFKEICRKPISQHPGLATSLESV
jgi:hypothetical protein